MSDVTRLLAAIQHGDARAGEELLPLFYAELRQLARAKMARDNMSDGPDAYELPAARAIDGSEETAIQQIPLTGVALPAGEHILAISVHNHAKSSSDLRLAGVTLVEIEAGPAPKK